MLCPEVTCDICLGELILAGPCPPATSAESAYFSGGGLGRVGPGSDETNIRAMQAPSSSRPQFTAVEERELSTVKANESLFLNYVARFEAAMRSCKQEDDQRSN